MKDLKYTKLARKLDVSLEMWVSLSLIQNISTTTAYLFPLSCPVSRCSFLLCPVLSSPISAVRVGVNKQAGQCSRCDSAIWFSYSLGFGIEGVQQKTDMQRIYFQWQLTVMDEYSWALLAVSCFCISEAKCKTHNNMYFKSVSWEY